MLQDRRICMLLFAITSTDIHKLVRINEDQFNLKMLKNDKKI